ncbi:Pumilio 12 [Hirschfeldia incana]|nr:Pumilio 12 [Hirschfeldia incana]
MDQRRNEPEFDELEKLLLEIPKVTSGNEYSRFPVCLSSNRSTPSIRKPAPFQEQNLPLPGDDYAFTSAFAHGNLNFGISNQTPENPQLMFIPSYHSPPCVHDQFESRILDPQMFRKLQHGGCFQNISPPQPQHYMPSSLSHHQGFDQSYINWRSVEEERLYLQEEQNMPVNPHYLYRQPQQSNRNLFCYGEDGDESSMRSLRKKMYYPEKLLVRSQLGVNTAKVIKYGVEDLSMSLNNLTMQPPKFFSLAEARGNIYYIAKDQHGCRFLQRKFAEGDENDISTIFDEIIDYISELMVDPFGNYLVQKLLEVCNDDQRMQIVCSITRKPGLLIKISCDMHGTRVIQKIVETVKRQDEISIIISALRHGIVTIMKNVNGNHVVQRCLQYLLPHCKKLLFGAAMTHCVELATDRHGCCVLQKCIGHFEGEQKDRLVSKIASNALLLSQDPFGNYALQYVFELHLEWAVNKILEQLEGNYTKLSMQKCSSNVVEKCLTLADDKHQARIIRELVTYGGLDQVMLDPFGNYVIQAALKQSKGTLHGLLVDAIKVYISSLRTNTYGKKVLSALNSKN